jgi:hypothetical protein
MAFERWTAMPGIFTRAGRFDAGTVMLIIELGSSTRP